MRTVILVLSLLAATSFAIVAAPGADAIGTCTSLTNAAQPADGPHCPALLCLGTSWSYGEYYYECGTEIPPQPICECMPA